MASFYLSTNVKVEIGVRYSKFIKFVKATKRLCLSEEAWGKLKECIEGVDYSHETGSKFEVELGGDKTLVADTFKNTRTTTLCEAFERDGKLGTKYFPLTRREWMSLKARIEEIDRVLSYDISYKLSETEWTLLEDQPIPDVNAVMLAGVREKKLIPRICNDYLVKMIYKHLLVEAIRISSSTVCVGCIAKSNNEEMHCIEGKGCKASWQSMVDVLLESVEFNVHLDKTVSRFTAAVGWDVGQDEFDLSVISQEESRNLVLGHPFGCCEKCASVVDVYAITFRGVFNTFDSMFK